MFVSRAFILKEIIRNVSKLSVRGQKNANPGINRRAKLLNVTSEDIDEEDIEDESDFTALHRSHKQHLREMEAMKELEKYHIVKQKYFKESSPNFLTWHDKEHMRYLHRTDPEEWTVEKLSEGFPALPETIAKIVKSTWVKKNQNRIRSHDEKVQSNWKLFKTNQIKGLDNRLEVHLKKFTDRALILTPFEAPGGDKEKNLVTIEQKNMTGEFSEIINNYNKVIQSTNTKKVRENMNMKSTNDKYSTEEIPSKKRGPIVTLDQLKMNVQNKAEKGRPMSAEEHIILDEMNKEPPKSSEAGIIEVKYDDVVVARENKFNQVSTIVAKDKHDVSHLVYPEKIKIPKKLYKSGSTYKLKDCYYDDDGQFLYRVPGMVN